MEYVSQVEFDRIRNEQNARFAASERVRKLKASAKFRAMTLAEKIAALNAAKRPEV